MINLNKKIQAQFKKMQETGKLFKVELSGDKVWEIYLNGFTPQDNPVFRDPSSTTHNCKLCNNFIRRYGNVVAIIDNKIVTIFDVEDEGEYTNSIHALKSIITASKVEDVFFETFNELNSLPYEVTTKKNEVFQLGIAKNYKRYTKEEAEKYGVVQPNEQRTFNHMHLFLDKKFVDMTGKSEAAIVADYRDAKNVFQRAMETISLDTLELVRDLINQGSLLDGQTHLYKIEQFIPLKKEYDLLPVNERDNWCWTKSFGLPFAKFRNELIGVLCSDLSEGVELNNACQLWNKRVDPVNYMKTTAPITKKQIEDAKAFVEENGYVESFNRRFATIDDIKVSEILHANAGDGKIEGVSIFDGVKATNTRHKRNEFDGVEVVHIDKFMTDILPHCTSVEAFLTNKHAGNFVSLTTANVKESKPIFKWNNNYSWTFNGNLAGKSQIKDAVIARGGKTKGVLNIRLHFPNTVNDYDLHVFEPTGNHIYFSNVRKRHTSSGMLDLDAQGMDGSYPSESRVENIIYTDLHAMPKGDFRVVVNNYNTRDNNYGFTLEVEINGETTSFVCNQQIPQGYTVDVCTIRLKDGELSIIPLMPVHDSNSLSTEIYGLNTNEFHKVNLVCLSPNHWGDNNVGNKHYFFMLDKAKSPVNIRSFHNENLLPELAAHRKVLEVLGNTSMIESTDKQLSGLGFNATVRDELIVKLQGNFKRTIKIQF